MKNFDIEKLERKNIYKAPENFFGDIQENVFDKIKLNPKTESKPAKIFHLSRNYAVAASLVLLFGIAAFWQFNNPDDVSVNTFDSLKTVKNIPEKQPENEAAKAYQTLKNDIREVENETSENVVKFAKAEPQKSTQKAVETMASKAKTESASATEVQFEQMMKELSNAEIADIGKGTEQDVYLDLYY